MEQAWRRCTSAGESSRRADPSALLFTFARGWRRPRYYQICRVMEPEDGEVAVTLDMLPDDIFLQVIAAFSDTEDGVPPFDAV